MQRIYEKNYIMDENNSLSEYIKILLGHNRTNGAVYAKNNFKVEICSALQLFDSHHTSCVCVVQYMCLSCSNDLVSICANKEIYNL